VEKYKHHTYRNGGDPNDPFRRRGEGFHFFGLCKNKNCDIYFKPMTSYVGLSVEGFDPRSKEITDKCICPRCEQKAEWFSYAICNDCEFQIEYSLGSDQNVLIPRNGGYERVKEDYVSWQYNLETKEEGDFTPAKEYDYLCFRIRRPARKMVVHEHNHIHNTTKITNSVVNADKSIIGCYGNQTIENNEVL